MGVGKDGSFGTCLVLCRTGRALGKCCCCLFGGGGGGGAQKNFVLGVPVALSETGLAEASQLLVPLLRLLTEAFSKQGWGSILIEGVILSHVAQPCIQLRERVFLAPLSVGMAMGIAQKLQGSLCCFCGHFRRQLPVSPASSRMWL